MLVKGFPFSVVYRPSPNEILVVALRRIGSGRTTGNRESSDGLIRLLPALCRSRDVQNRNASLTPPQCFPFTTTGAATSFITTKFPPPMSRR